MMSCLIENNKNKKVIERCEKYNKCNEITNICEYNKVRKVINNLNFYTLNNY